MAKFAKKDDAKGELVIPPVPRGDRVAPVQRAYKAWSAIPVSDGGDSRAKKGTQRDPFSNLASLTTGPSLAMKPSLTWAAAALLSQSLTVVAEDTTRGLIGNGKLVPRGRTHHLSSRLT